MRWTSSSFRFLLPPDACPSSLTSRSRPASFRRSQSKADSTVNNRLESSLRMIEIATPTFKTDQSILPQSLSTFTAEYSVHHHHDCMLMRKHHLFLGDLSQFAEKSLAHAFSSIFWIHKQILQLLEGKWEMKKPLNVNPTVTFKLRSRAKIDDPGTYIQAWLPSPGGIIKKVQCHAYRFTGSILRSGES